MQIKNVLFNKGDFLYTIEYFDGKSVRKVSTNEEALKSLPDAVQKLGTDLKILLPVDAVVKVTVNSVRYGKTDESAASVQASVSIGEVRMGVVVKVRPVGPREEFPPAGLTSVNDSLKHLREEIIRYVNGERSQGEFSFDFDTEIGEKTENAE